MIIMNICVSRSPPPVQLEGMHRRPRTAFTVAIAVAKARLFYRLFTLRMASPCFRWLPLPEGPESRATGGDGAGVVPYTSTKDGDTSTNGATSSEDDIRRHHVLLLRAEDAVALQREARALLDSASLGHATLVCEERWRRYVATHLDSERMMKDVVVACEMKRIPGLRRCEFVVTTRNGRTWHWEPFKRAVARMPWPGCLSVARQPPMTAAERTDYGMEKMGDC